MSLMISAAVVQMCAKQDVQRNLSTCESLVGRAAEQGAQLVVLPENFPFIGGLKEKLELAEPLSPERPGPIVNRMMGLAQQHRIHLVLGGIPVVSRQHDRFYNTAVVLDPQGHILASYRKIHLFDIDIPDGATFCESEYVLPGDEVVTTNMLGATFGLSICYDLRFPYLYQELTRRGAQVIFIPAAFTLHTGKDHWFPLLRARAIENQVYVLAAAQHGHHTPQRTSYGKACIIDPWGTIVAQAPDRDGVAMTTLDLDYLAQVRSQLPCLAHQRDLTSRN